MEFFTKLILGQALWVGLILCLSLMVGCQKTEISNNNLKCSVDAVTGSKDDITGKWKLVKGDIFSSIERENKIEDYSCNHVVYQFMSDGKLRIISDIEKHMGPDIGEYIYEIIADGKDGQNDLLKVGNKLYSIVRSSNKMTIEMNPIDPLAIYESRLTAYFVRIQ